MRLAWVIACVLLAMEAPAAPLFAQWWNVPKPVSAGTVLPYADKLVYWIKVSDATETNIPDGSGNGNVFSLYDAQNVCTWADGAWTIPNTNGSQVHYFANTLTNVGNNLTNYTICVWINPRTQPAAAGLVCSRGSAALKSTIVDQAVTNLIIRSQSSGNITVNNAIGTNAWQLITVTHWTTNNASGTFAVWRGLTLVTNYASAAVRPIEIDDFWKICWDDAGGYVFDGQVGPWWLTATNYIAADQTNAVNLGRKHQ